MGSMLARIKQGHWWKFHGGIHPPEQKFLTKHKPIRNLPLPDMLVLPLKQHIGQKGDLIVKIGDKVLKGQALTNSQHPMAVPIHAPTSGTITDIKPTVIAHPSGLSELCIFLQTDGLEQWQPRNICQDYNQLSNQEILAKITNAGIAGMGGAGFPTNVKINIKSRPKFLIINAAECEPYITADDLLIREHCSEIIDGINILNKTLQADNVLIAIEDNKPEAIKALKQATESNDNFQVCVLPTIYPTGGEKQLIKILTGQEVPKEALPSSLGIVMQNVATCFAIADAVINDIPLIRRVVTVSGKAVEKPQNVWALLGTPIKHLLQHCEYQKQSPEHLILGGPMMGFSLPSSDIGITKTTNCILAPSSKEIPKTNNEVDCIRCGQCADVCPSQLLPQELQWFAKAKDHQQLQHFDLFDCIECGACAYVCPSQIPLVHYYRIAKAEIRQQQQLDLKAEKAKARFEARKERLIREKVKREEKHRKAAEARKAAMNSDSSEAKNAKFAVAAALARAKAKKAQTATETIDDKQPVDDKKSAVAAAIARAKAKKDQSKVATTTDNKSDIKSETSKQTSNEKIELDSKDDKKSAVAAAIARAKAKKDQSKVATITDNKSDIKSDTSKQTSHEKIEIDSKEDKKSAVAAAIARAKAKKESKKSATNTEISADTANTSKDKEKPKTVEQTKAEKNKPSSEPNKKLTTKNSTAKSVKNAKKVNTDVEIKAEVKAEEKSAPKKSESKKSQQNKKVSKATTSTQKNKPKSTDNGKDEKVTQSLSKAEKIAQAVAKAKARKAKFQTNIEQSAIIDSNNNTDKNSTNDADKIKAKKEKIAAAVAKAKAKKQQEQKKPTNNQTKESS